MLMGQDTVDNLSVAAWCVLNLTQDFKSMNTAPSPQSLTTLSFSSSGQGGPYIVEDRTPSPVFPQHCS